MTPLMLADRFDELLDRISLPKLAPLLTREELNLIIDALRRYIPAQDNQNDPAS